MTFLLGTPGSTNRYSGGSGGPSLVYLGDAIPLWSGSGNPTFNQLISPIGSVYAYDTENDPHTYYPNIPIRSLTVTRGAGDFSGANQGVVTVPPDSNGLPKNQIGRAHV